MFNLKINVNNNCEEMPIGINMVELKSVNRVLRPRALAFFKRYTSWTGIDDIVDFMIDAGEWINTMTNSLDVASFVRILEFGLDVPHDEPDRLMTRSWYLSSNCSKNGYRRTEGYRFVCDFSKQWRWTYANSYNIDPVAYGVSSISELAEKIESLEDGDSISIGLFRSKRGEYESFLKLERKKGGRYSISVVER